MFETLEQVIFDASDTIKPVEEISVSQNAAEKRNINVPGAHVGKWANDKTPYLIEPMDTLSSHEHDGMIFAGPARTGKALALDTPVITPNGWRTMGDLKVGDQVFDEMGQPCSIVATTPVMYNRPCYRVRFSDGQEIVCDRDHQWVVNDAHRPNRQRVMFANEICDTHLYGSKKRARYSVDVSLPLKYESKFIGIEPYVLGAWLGDGHSIGARLSSGRLDVANMVEILESYMIPVRIGPDGNNNFVLYLSEKTPPTGRGESVEGISKELRKLGMCGPGKKKYIPREYLEGSIPQRYELLRGLMDTDGHVDIRGQCEFCTTSPEIAEGFGELLSSLGYKFCLLKRPAAKKIAHRFMFYVREGDIIFKLRRKQLRLDQSRSRSILKNSRRQIVSVEQIDSVPVRCITVDGESHQYLAGEKMVPTHNSDQFFNYFLYLIEYDPSDFQIVLMTNNVAREWSQREFRRFLRLCPEAGSRVMPGKQNLNVFDVKFKSNTELLIRWPAISELSGKTIPRGWFADYDRMPDDIEGEGNAYDLGRKRAETFGKYGMWVAESSPGREITKPKYRLPSPHWAPPTKGILDLYNRGDRRRWYWRCPVCSEPFEPTFKCLSYPNSRDFVEASEMVTLKCPSSRCGFDMTPDMKYELNLGGKWIKDGQIYLPDGTVQGKGVQADIASFWMFGPSAGFQSWQKLVYNYLTAMQTFETTGDTGPLKKTVNTDQGMPFLAPSMEKSRTPEWLAQRKEDWGGTREEPVVPEGVLFLIATVDIQAGSRSGFVVQIHGIKKNYDICFVDMFKIRKSNRPASVNDANIDGFHICDPAGYPEDWKLLVDQVIMKSYPLGDDSGRRMAILKTGGDMGGKKGVSPNAYNFWRLLRDNPETELDDGKRGKQFPDGLSKRYQLIRGNPHKVAPRAKINMPDSGRKDRNSGARGDVPVLDLNSLLLKDQADAMLNRTEPGGGFVQFPAWAPNWLYDQLTGEVRKEDGWHNVRQGANEAWDLFYYCIGMLLHPDINYENIDWNRPPRWALDWDRNENVFTLDQPIPFAVKQSRRYDLEAIARQLA